MSPLTLLLSSQGLENAERGPNYYQILGLRRGSSAIEIKRAYRQLSLELHPDKNKSQDAADRFSKMSAALEVRDRGSFDQDERRMPLARQAPARKQAHGGAAWEISLVVCHTVRRAVFFSLWAFSLFFACTESEQRPG